MVSLLDSLTINSNGRDIMSLFLIQFNKDKIICVVSGTAVEMLCGYSKLTELRLCVLCIYSISIPGVRQHLQFAYDIGIC